MSLEDSQPTLARVISRSIFAEEVGPELPGEGDEIQDLIVEGSSLFEGKSHKKETQQLCREWQGVGVSPVLGLAECAQQMRAQVTSRIQRPKWRIQRFVLNTTANSC